MFLFLYFLKSNSVPSILPQQTTMDAAPFCFRRPDFHFHHPAAIFYHTHCRQEKRISAGAVLPPSKAGAAGRLSSRRGWGCWLIQFQKRGISNCPGKPEFHQRGQNSSRSDLRLLRSSDRPLRTAKFWPPGTVRNIRRFFLWIGQHPHLVREKDGRQLQPRTAGRACHLR